MKKVKNIILILIMVLFISACNSGKSKTPESPDNTYKNFSIKISGDYDITLKYEDIKDLIQKDITASIKNPLYTAEKTYVGINLNKLLESKEIKDYINVYFKGDNSSIRFTHNNLKEDCYIVLSEDGKELAKPKFIKTSISDMYYISDLKELIILNSEVEI